MGSNNSTTVEPTAAPAPTMKDVFAEQVDAEKARLRGLWLSELGKSAAAGVPSAEAGRAAHAADVSPDEAETAWEWARTIQASIVEFAKLDDRRKESVRLEAVASAECERVEAAKAQHEQAQHAALAAGLAITRAQDAAERIERAREMYPELAREVEARTAINQK